jgi:hypothetical protein
MRREKDSLPSSFTLPLLLSRKRISGKLLLSGSHRNIVQRQNSNQIVPPVENQETAHMFLSGKLSIGNRRAL